MTALAMEELARVKDYEFMLDRETLAAVEEIRKKLLPENR